MKTLTDKHTLQLTDEDVLVLLNGYETKAYKIIKPLQRFETGLEVSRYKDDNGIKECSAVDFNVWMNDHNYRVALGTPDSLTDVVYTKQYKNYMRYKEWYLVEIRARYNEIMYKIEELAEIIGYDCTHLVGKLNFTESEIKSMNKFCEENAYVPDEAPPEGYFQNAIDGRDVNWQI
jgi:hypothetical protein|tara:strand:- start:384 stop:911 length:528 start_codon:yes stop_codon:yes gene_type:complete